MYLINRIFNLKIFKKIKNLNLENIGVQELDAKEMNEINGGAWFKVRGLFGAIFGGNSWDAVEITLFGIELVK
ncbi:hypothetical protein [Pedobacter xixiisoli]|uniref:Bacteriocin-type signal sequence-containing protein n=1 Tax=Pedobacter xixiisoli TaxID=1476464 RepID=A0A286AD99_9SPHI|nr:hypothetical protein [Pedobacter xixiisoli]SOD19882.1 hypothetical protein SAMN06297358_3589 [Pedobacter xixiisoli]